MLMTPGCVRHTSERIPGAPQIRGPHLLPCTFGCSRWALVSPLGCKPSAGTAGGLCSIWWGRERSGSASQGGIPAAAGRAQHPDREGKEGAGCWVAATGSGISLRQPMEMVVPSHSSALLARENDEKPSTDGG